jgi:pyridinium-3,5-biscarboxylic acid mononucleotide sulfurtransferase
MNQANNIDMDLSALRERLESHIAGLGPVVVGFSAGVDSSVVLAAAVAALGERALGVTAITETITEEDVALAEELVDRLGARHEWIEYSELAIDKYAANPTNRCYFCKDALYTRLAAIAADRPGATVLDGTNADDASDYRPGRDAAREQGVRSPLLELGITKAQVRALAAAYGLPNAEKPSAPCLSSRVPYGTSITLELLRQVGRAERSLRALGFGELRVRHHGDVARIEIPPADFARAVELAGAIDTALREAGYRFVALDLAGFRSGSLNGGIAAAALTHIELPSR